MKEIAQVVSQKPRGDSDAWIPTRLYMKLSTKALRTPLAIKTLVTMDYGPSAMDCSFHSIICQLSFHTHPYRP